MTLITPDDNSGEVREILSGVAEHYQDAIDVFRRAIRDVENGEDSGSPGCRNDLRQLRRAMDLLLNEKSRIDSENRKQQGIVYDFAVDFKSARAEVRRRMARLRDAASSGPVPE